MQSSLVAVTSRFRSARQPGVREKAQHGSERNRQKQRAGESNRGSVILCSSAICSYIHTPIRLQVAMVRLSHEEGCFRLI